MKIDSTGSKRRHSVRMKDFDYSIDARWFVTICTHERKCTLGEIVEEEMKLNEIGRIVEECWLAIPDHFPNVILDEFVIMPNHIHGLLEVVTLGEFVGARHALPLQDKGKDNTNNIAKSGKPIAGSLGIIIGSFKSAVTKRINELHGKSSREPFWQRNYYEHGIRTDVERERIQNYIKENPLLWNEDDDNPANLSKRR